MTIPLIRAAGLHGYVELAESLGVDVPRALHRVGLSARLLEDPDCLISHMAGIHLMEQTAAEARCPAFGLRMSQLQDLSVIGTTALSMQYASVFGEALSLCARYTGVHGNAIHFDLQPVTGEPEYIDIVYSLDLPERPPLAQTLELSLGFIMRGMQFLGQGKLAPVLVMFPHPRISDLSEYMAVFNCPCRFEMPMAAIRIRESYLHYPMPKADPMLKELAQSYLRQHFLTSSQLFVDRVRSTIRHLLGETPVSQELIANELYMHPRTLQRRLESEGHQFKSVYDRILQERFVELLSWPKPMSLTQIALALGYSEQAALTRSCHRWFQCTPTVLRDTLQAALGNPTLKSTGSNTNTPRDIEAIIAK